MMMNVESRIWYEDDLKRFDPTTKVKTQCGKIVTVRKLIAVTKSFQSSHPSFNDSLEYNFGKIEILVKTKIMRDNQIHPYDCEFASGTSCTCWCEEKYHGMMGVGAIIQ